MRARRREDRSEYQVVRRWPWAATAARVYEAFHRRTGAAALLLRPGRPGDWKPAARPWSAMVRSTPHELAVELAPSCVVHLEDVTLALHRLSGALAQVDTQPEAQAALVGEVASVRRWRARVGVRPGYVAGLACAVLLAIVVGRPSKSRIAGNMLAESGGAAQLAPQAVSVPIAVARRPLLAGLARPMPRKPFDGQARPDKDGKCEGRGERNINGACWVEMKLIAPCDDRSYEWKGGCYLPVWPPLKEPQAMRDHANE